MAKTIDISGSADKALGTLKTNVAPGAAYEAIGAAVVARFQTHFLELPSNKRGFPSTGLYAKFARSTNYRLTNRGVMISVNHVAARQRYYGGLIKPGPGKQFLTIAHYPKPTANGRVILIRYASVLLTT